MISAQEYINNNFPKQGRLNITDLEITKKNLEGHLDLRDFANLKKLDCSENKITSIDLSKNEKIKWIDCSDNLLNDIDFSYQNPEELEGIIVHNNNLSWRDLSCFSRFINLQSLFLGTYDEKKIEKNIYNRFHGSLEHLKNLESLLDLDISGTDVNEGLEFLPLENFYCASKRAGAKVEQIRLTLNLNEEEAESEEIADNREKISRIRAYQFYTIWQRNIHEARQAQNNFLQSLKQYRLAIMRIKHKTEWDDLRFLLNLQTSARCITQSFPHFFQNVEDKLRKTKQELIEKSEDLTRIEVDNLCQAQINFIKSRNLLHQSRQRWQGMEALIQIHTTPRR